MKTECEAPCMTQDHVVMSTVKSSASGRTLIDHKGKWPARLAAKLQDRSKAWSRGFRGFRAPGQTPKHKVDLVCETQSYLVGTIAVFFWHWFYQDLSKHLDKDLTSGHKVKTNTVVSGLRTRSRTMHLGLQIKSKTLHKYTVTVVISW